VCRILKSECPCVTLNVPSLFPAVKVKVKVRVRVNSTLKYAMKAQRGSTAIAVLFL
jgi:hypothetical protein